MYCTFEYSIFSLKVLCVILLRECNFNFYFFLCLYSDKLILESWNKCSRTNCKRIVLSFSALKCFSINKSFKIKNNFISVFNRTSFYCNCSCVLSCLFLDLSINFFLCYACRYFIYLKSFVLSKSNFRSCSNKCCEDERFSFLDLCNIDLRLRYDLKITLIVSL